MSHYNEDKMVSLRVLGPGGKPYVDLENEFTEPFDSEGFYFSVPRLFSTPPETTVLVTIGIGVITGVSSYLLTSLIDRLFKIKKDKPSNNINITVNVQIGEKHIALPSNKQEITKELEKIRVQHIAQNTSNK